MLLLVIFSQLLLSCKPTPSDPTIFFRGVHLWDLYKNVPQYSKKADSVEALYKHTVPIKKEHVSQHWHTPVQYVILITTNQPGFPLATIQAG